MYTYTYEGAVFFFFQSSPRLHIQCFLENSQNVTWMKKKIYVYIYINIYIYKNFICINPIVYECSTRFHKIFKNFQSVRVLKFVHRNPECKTYSLTTRLSEVNFYKYILIFSDKLHFIVLHVFCNIYFIFII